MVGTESVVLGPTQTFEEARSRRLQTLAAQIQANDRAVDLSLMACNCMGPQPGETKCPCALRAEMQQGLSMIQNGITIGGRRYKLVPQD